MNPLPPPPRPIARVSNLLSRLHRDGGGARLAGLFDHAIGLVLGLATLAILVWTPDMGFTRDEGFYFRAAREYGGWFEELETNIEADQAELSFTKENIDQHWSYNPEHPALIKTLFGLSYRAFAKKREWLEPSTAMRFPTMVFTAVLVWLLYVFMAEAFSRVAGLFAVGALMAQPRVFFHAHLACFDAAMMTMWFAVIWAYWKSLRSTAWVWGAGILFGIALSTKLNGFFLPFVLLAHWGLTGWAEFRLSRSAARNALTLHIPRVPRAFFTMAVVGPVIFYLLWPRHWFDTFNRIAWYIERHLAHEHYAVFYRGELLTKPPFPRDFPFVMSFYTIPLVILAALAVGVLALAVETDLRRRRKFVWRRLVSILGGPLLASAVAGVLALVRRGHGTVRERFLAARERLRALRPHDRPPVRDYPHDSRGTLTLIALAALFPFVIIAREETPIFGGTKHWMTAMPFVAAIAGVGFAWAFERLQVLASSVVTAFSRPLLRNTVSVACVPLILWPAVREVIHTHPHGTSYYNELMGGHIGAADAGMHRQFWGYASRSALGWLNENAPEGASVHFHNTLAYAVDMYEEDGLLREDIRHAWSLESADYILYHHQRAFTYVLYNIWRTYDLRSPVYVVSIDGVPLLSVYENPTRRASARRVREQTAPDRDAREQEDEESRPARVIPKRAPASNIERLERPAALEPAGVDRGPLARPPADRVPGEKPKARPRAPQRLH